MRADRLVAIMLCLQTEGRLTAKALAERFEVSERTIYRDMDALCAAGIPVYADPGVGGGFTLSATYRANMDGLTTPEIQALFVSATGATLHELGIDKALQTAMPKLLNALPEEQRSDVTWIQDSIYLDSTSWKAMVEDPAYIQMAQTAIRNQLEVVLRYHSTTAAAPSRRFQARPYGLVAKAGIWFLVAEANQNVHAYRVARILSMEITNIPFQRPQNFHLQQFWHKWLTLYESNHAQQT